MNHLNDSPIGLTNEVASGYTPKQGSAGGANGGSNKKQTINALFLLGEDLEKIRPSNHSSHRAAAAATTDDADHEASIKDLLYPALESEDEDSDIDSDFEFFEEDYAQAQAAIAEHGSAASSRPSAIARPRGQTASGQRNSIFGESRTREDASPMNQSSFMAAWRRGGGRTYSDVSSEKVRR
jgi:hypothetical protein